MAAEPGTKQSRRQRAGSEEPEARQELPPLSLEDEAALVRYAEDMNSLLGKLKQADETGTNALLLNSEVGALLAYMKAVQQTFG